MFSSKEKEKMRWQFAGQIYAGYCANHDVSAQVNDPVASKFVKYVMKEVDALIAELEKTAPKEAIAESENHPLSGGIQLTSADACKHGFCLIGPMTNYYCEKCGAMR